MFLFFMNSQISEKNSVSTKPGSENFTMLWKEQENDLCSLCRAVFTSFYFPQNSAEKRKMLMKRFLTDWMSSFIQTIGTWKHRSVTGGQILRRACVFLIIFSLSCTGYAPQLPGQSVSVASAGTVTLKNVYISTSLDGVESGTLTTNCKSSQLISSVDLKSCFGSHPEYYKYQCILYAASLNSKYGTVKIGNGISNTNFDGDVPDQTKDTAFKLINVFGSSAAIELVDYCQDKKDTNIYLHLMLKRTEKNASVTCEDRIGNANGTLLGSSTWTMGMGTTASGASRGSDPSSGAYYKGYVYSSCTSAMVEKDGCKVYRYFTPVTNSVSLTGSTGIASVSGGGNKTYGTSVSVTASVKSGYHWTGWSGSQSSSSNPYTFSMPDTSVTLMANASANQYTINFQGNGADSGNIDEQRLTYDSPVNLYANRFVRKGYTFQGWSLTSSGSVQYVDRQSILNLTEKNGAVIPLYAIWSKNSYRLRFIANGGTCEVRDKSVPFGNTLGSLPVPVREGYTFEGWYTDTEGGVQVTASTRLEEASDQAVYAHWKPISYTVVFQANGGSGEMEPQTMIYDQEEKLSENQFEWEGYTFLGWNTDKYAKDVLYEDMEEVSELTSEAGGVENLYAVWIQNTYTIRLDGNGSFSPTMGAVSAKYDTDVMLPVNRYERRGYLFSGWNNRSGGDGELHFEDGASVCNLTAQQEGVVTLYACWQPVSYTIVFQSCGGIGDMQEMTAQYDMRYELPVCRYEKEGYEFLGWSNEPDGETIVYQDGEMIENLTEISNGMVNLYAVWEEHVPERTGLPLESNHPDHTQYPGTSTTPVESGRPNVSSNPKESEMPAASFVPVEPTGPDQPEISQGSQPEDAVGQTGQTIHQSSDNGLLSKGSSSQTSSVSPISGLNVGESTVLDGNHLQNLGEKGNPVVAYKSSDHSIAYVDEQGNLIATGKDGVASVSTTLADGTVKEYTVSTVKGVTSVTLEKGTVKKVKLILGRKEKVVLKYSVYKYLDGTSSNRRIVTVKSTSKKLTVRGRKKGSATITVEYENGMTGLIQVRVKKAPKKLKVENISLAAGKSRMMRVGFNKGAYSNKRIYKVTEGKKRISVSQNGKIVGLKKGRAKVTVTTYNGKKKTAVVHIH